MTNMTEQEQSYHLFLAQWLDTDTNHICVHTSGSTGTPKEILLDKQLVSRSARRTIDFFGINSSSTLHSCINFNFIGGKMMIVRACIADCRLTFETPSNQALAAASGRKDLVSVVPSQMAGSLQRHRMPDVANYLIGGSAIDPILRRHIAEAPITAWESYGMTETASHIAIRRVTAEETPFVPLSGIETGIDSRGCLTIWEKGVPDPISVVTNDLAEVYADGSFRIIGRADDMIVTGGRKANPLLIEEILRPYISCPFFITSQPDPTWTNAIVLATVCSQEEADSIFRSIQSLPDSIIPAWQRPKHIRALRSLPLTASGKLKRH